MQPIERDPEDLIASRVRYHRALRLVKRENQHTIKTLQAIQRDHVKLLKLDLQPLRECQ